MIRAFLDNPDPHRLLAAALGHLNRVEEAAEALKRAVAVMSPISLEMYARRRHIPWVRSDDREHILDGPRKAGWQGSQHACLRQAANLSF